MQNLALAAALLVGLTFSSTLPADAQFFGGPSFSRFSTGDYMARNKDLRRRISDAERAGLISRDQANTLKDAVKQQAENFRIMRASDGFLSADELTALETLLDRTSASLDNLTGSPRQFSYRQFFFY